jgi:hypothetical protein
MRHGAMQKLFMKKMRNKVEKKWTQKVSKIFKTIGTLMPA